MNPKILGSFLCIFAFCLLSSFADPEEPAGWTWRAPLPGGYDVQYAASSPDTVVAADWNGNVFTKTEDGSWTKVSVFQERMVELAWTGTKFLAIPKSKNVGLLYSDHGTEWTHGTATEVSKSASYLASSDNETIALASTKFSWVSSDADRLVWSKKPMPALPKVSRGGSLAGSRTRAGTYNAIASNGTIFVAVGDGATIVSSTNGGNTWRKISAPTGTTAPLTSVASNGVGFVAMGTDYYSFSDTPETYKTVLYSEDGATWANGTFPTNENDDEVVFRTVFPHADGYIALATTGEFFTSPNGDQWTEAGSFEGFGGWPLLFSTGVQSGWDPDTSYFFDGSGMIVSFDGTNFTGEIADYLGGHLWKESFSGAAFNDFVYLLDSNSALRIISSQDGETFTANTSPSDFESGFKTFARVEDEIIAFNVLGGEDFDTDPPGFYSSTDGEVWTPVGNIYDEEIPSLVFHGNVVSFASPSTSDAVVVVAIEEVYSGFDSFAIPRIYTSSDWSDWNEISVPGLSQYELYGQARTPRVEWDGNRFLLLAQNGRLLTSPDGITWTQLPPLPSDTAAYTNKNFGKGYSTSNAVAEFASNGSTIVVRPGKFGRGYFEVFGPDRFFVFLNGAWKQSAPTSPGSRYEGSNVVWDGSKFTASSYSQINTSPDGMNWTSRQVERDISHLLWTGSQFVGLTTYFGVLTHPDGLSPRMDSNFTDITPYSNAVPSQGQTYTVEVESNQAWKAVKSVPWITVSPTSGNGDADITVIVQANQTPLPRSGVVNIGGRIHTITQESFIAINSQAQTVVHPGTTYTVDVTSTKPWKITNPAKWVTWVSSVPPVNGFISGNATITFTVQPQIQPNKNPTPRTVVVSLGGVPHTISQEAAPRSMVGNTGKFTIPVSTKSEWTASSDSSWIRLSRTSGIGTGSVFITLPENPTSNPRTAILTIAGLTYQVTQNGQTLPLLHKGVYTGIIGNWDEPTLVPEGADSVFEGIDDAEGRVTVAVTATPSGATYTGSLVFNGLTYKGRGIVSTDSTPWRIIGDWTAKANLPVVPVDLNFVVDSENTKLIRGAVEVEDPLNGPTVMGLLAGKSVLHATNQPFSDAGNYVSILGDLWPAAASVSINASGLAVFTGKFVDGTALTMSIPVFGTTGLDGEWGLLFYHGIYGGRGTLGGYYYQVPDTFDPQIVLAFGESGTRAPARAEFPGADPADKLAEDLNVPFGLNPYIKPAANQPALEWTSNNPAFGLGLIEIFSFSPHSAEVYGSVRLNRKTNALSWDPSLGANINKMTFSFASARGFLEGSVNIPVEHPDDPSVSLGTRVVKFFGVANQDFDNFRSNDGFRAIFLSPTIRVTRPSPAETIGEVNRFDIIPTAN